MQAGWGEQNLAMKRKTFKSHTGTRSPDTAPVPQGEQDPVRPPVPISVSTLVPHKDELAKAKNGAGKGCSFLFKMKGLRASAKSGQTDCRFSFREHSQRRSRLRRGVRSWAPSGAPGGQQPSGPPSSTPKSTLGVSSLTCIFHDTLK